MILSPSYYRSLSGFLGFSERSPHSFRMVFEATDNLALSSLWTDLIAPFNTLIPGTPSYSHLPYFSFHFHILTTCFVLLFLSSMLLACCSSRPHLTTSYWSLFKAQLRWLPCLSPSPRTHCLVFLIPISLLKHLYHLCLCS